MRLVRWRGRRATRCDVLAGWGHKPTAAATRRLAARHGLAYVAFEDGFLHSVDVRRTRGPLSLIADPDGIYYDARGASRLEILLEGGGSETPGLIARAGAGLALMRRLRLAKYNAAPDRDAASLGLAATRARVLVVDQTAGDASIEGGLAGPADFTAMLDCAVAENPDAEILVKLHPEVVSGRRAGHLAAAAARHAGVRVIAQAVNPWSLFDVVRRVYTVSSQTGMEALIAGLPVSCFGAPYYAGWGLTDDRKAIPRRTRRLTLEQLFAAAYLVYPRYVDPYHQRPCSFEDAAEILAFLRARHLEEAVATICVGVSGWKRRTVADFVAGAAGPPRFRRRAHRAVAEAARDGARILAWATRLPDGLEAACAAAGVTLHRAEDGFLRSVGLGSALHRAASMCIDRTGIYYDPARPSDLETLIERGSFPPALLARARALREAIVALGLSKYNLGGESGAAGFADAPPGRPRILVPGQVESDESVRHGAPETGSNRALVAAVRARHPHGYIVYKPHPDVVAGYRHGALSHRDIARLADRIVVAAPIARLIAECDRVETMTSLAGFEALLRGRAVSVHGRPFYAGWGLTEDLVAMPRRRRRIDLDTLVAAALILYPRYVDPLTALPCSPELVLARLAEPSSLPRPARLRPAALAWHALACVRRQLHAQRRLPAA